MGAGLWQTLGTLLEWVLAGLAGMEPLAAGAMPMVAGSRGSDVSPRSGRAAS
jgi:hypothetical protein